MNNDAGSTITTITELNNVWNQASLRMDVAVLDSLYSDDCIFHFQNGLATNKTWVINLLSSGDVQFESIANDDIRIRVYENSALWTSKSTVTEVYKGKATQGAYLWLRLWSNAKGKWQIVAFQSTTVPSAS